MSLSNSRIPKTAVEISETPVELVYLEEITESAETDSDNQELIQAQATLEQEAQQLAVSRQQLEQRLEALEAEKADLLNKQAEWEQTKQTERQEWEKEKQQVYQTVTRFLYEESIQLAEQVVQQTIDERQLKMTPLLVEVIQKLPISFEKLCVTIHPETLEALKAEHADDKEAWLMQNIDWRFDMRLGYGEFSVEEEKEYFEYRFPEIFAAIKVQSERLLAAKGGTADV